MAAPMRNPDRFEIRLAPEAEPAFLGLAEWERMHVRNVVEGVAEVSALAPLELPLWFRRLRLEPPLLRLRVAGLRISFELDGDARAIRICAVDHVGSGADQEAPHASTDDAR